MIQSVFVLLKKVGLRFAFLLGLMTFVRFFFITYNSSCFSDWGWLELLKGGRVDASFIVYTFSLYFLSLLFLQGTRYYKVVKTIFFSLGILILLIPEMIDLMYFEFVLKRMTSDIFVYLRSGGEFWELLPQFLIDFWWIILLYIGGIVFLIRQEYRSRGVDTQTSIVSKILTVVFWIGLTVLIGRGGLQERPLELSNATQGVPSQNSAIVLNSGFSLFSSFFVDGLEKKQYFPSAELDSIYTLEKQVISSREPNKKNVVIIILESFSQEYTGFYNEEGVSYTPFFDSLLSQSYVYKNAYANGKRSVEALPAILAGLPSLMSTPYIFSRYAQNRINALPSILKTKGYNTSFYHGGHNGTMGFDGFCSQAGIDEYFGKNEYEGDLTQDFDGNWGIFDEPYLQYFAKELRKKKEPFFSSVFTLSSHHPYAIPEKYKNEFEEGTLPIHRAVRYSDHALRQFFTLAKHQRWFVNSVFILLADHTAQSNTEGFANSVGKYRIPIAVYEPGEKPKIDTVQVVQQLDVMTLVLERLGFNGLVKTFGNASDDRQKAMVYNDRLYQMITKDRFYTFDGVNLFSEYEKQGNQYVEQGLITDGLEERLMKGVIQKYSDVLIQNEFR